MSFDMFLKIDTILGESVDARHKDEIDVLSFSWGTELELATGGSGGATGKPRIAEVHIVATTSRATPPIAGAVTTGKRFATAKLTCRRPGADPFEFLTYEMTDLLITSYHTGGNAADTLPQDEFTLNFQTLVLSYTRQKADGSPDTPVTVTISQL